MKMLKNFFLLIILFINLRKILTFNVDFYENPNYNGKFL